MPEDNNPEEQTQPPHGSETAPEPTADEPATAEADPAATKEDVGDESPAATRTVTTYQSTPQGHRVIRRTGHREESREETTETVTETFPITYPELYQPPTASTEPTPVG